VPLGRGPLLINPHLLAFTVAPVWVGSACNSG